MGRFLTAGFYDKTFMKTQRLWPVYERILAEFGPGGTVDLSTPRRSSISNALVSRSPIASNRQPPGPSPWSAPLRPGQRIPELRCLASARENLQPRLERQQDARRSRCVSVGREGQLRHRPSRRAVDSVVSHFLQSFVRSVSVRRSARRWSFGVVRSSASDMLGDAGSVSADGHSENLD